MPFAHKEKYILETFNESAIELLRNYTILF